MYGIKKWCDRDIAPGDNWEHEIEKALNECQVALLLVSPDFLASRFINEREIPPIAKASQDASVPVLWLLVRPCLWQQFDFLSKTQSALPLDRCFASLELWQQDQILSDLCLKVKSSAWGLQILLDPVPREAGWLLKIKGRAHYSAPADPENINLGLLPFLAKNGLAIVPFVLNTSDGWWSQAPVEPDANGDFEATFHLGLEKRGVGNSYTIQVCVVQRIVVPVQASWSIPAVVKSSDPQICTRTM